MAPGAKGKSRTEPSKLQDTNPSSHTATPVTAGALLPLLPGRPPPGEPSTACTSRPSAAFHTRIAPSPPPTPPGYARRPTLAQRPRRGCPALAVAPRGCTRCRGPPSQTKAHARRHCCCCCLHRQQPHWLPHHPSRCCRKTRSSGGRCMRGHHPSRPPPAASPLAACRVR